MPECMNAPAPPRPYCAVFVDDNADVLRGLERLLRPLRGEWTMQFVTSGPAALEFLAAREADVLVTDLQMPGMSGVELMERVLDEHPAVIRIALSGRAERESVVQSAHLVHQYLSKPCEPGLLRERLEQAVRLKSLLGDRRLRSIVAAVSGLRSVPSIYLDLMTEMERPDPSVARIASIIANDPGLAAKVLQLINSAYFGLRAHVSDPETAVRLLGFETTRSLALAVHVYARLRGSRTVDPARIWEHCARTGRLARQVARHLRLSERCSSEAFTAGLLHDVGKLILADAIDEYADATAAGHAEGLDDAGAETRAFGSNHAQVGACLFGLWGLPYGIVEAIAWHHAPGDSGIAQSSAVTALHVANVLDHASREQDGTGRSLDERYLQALGLPSALAEWTRAIAGSGHE